MKWFSNATWERLDQGTAELPGETERATSLVFEVKICGNIRRYRRVWHQIWNRELYQNLYWTSPYYSKTSSWVRTMYWDSLVFRLFNPLPKHLTDLHGVRVKVFKQQFDFLLSKIPYEAISRQETKKKAAVSNSSFTKSQAHRIG